MSYDLYFMPILTEALAQPDVRQSLGNAFSLIERLGNQHRYAEGYRNFCQFLSESYSRRQLLNEQALRTTILSRAASTFAEPEVWIALDQMKKDQSLRFKDEYEALCREFGLWTTGTRVRTIQVFCDGRELGQVSFPTKQVHRTVDGMNPGHYALKLDSGMVIWEGQLCAHDLVWTQAFGEKSLELAAETIEIHRQPAREIQVPEAGITLRTFPGIETGSLEIELTR